MVCLTWITKQTFSVLLCVCVFVYLFGGYVAIINIHHSNRKYNKSRDTQHDVREVVE